MRLEPMLNRLSIIDKDGNQVPFRLNWAQREYLAAFESRWNQGKPVRVIVLKARQLGMSTLTEGIIFLLALNIENMRGMVIADETENSQGLLQMTENYWNTYPFKPMHDQKYNSRNELAWSDMNSSVKVSTARKATAGRSKTLRAVHASEVAFWLQAKETMKSLLQSVPTRPETFVCLESTANGVGGYFYDEWEAAVSGETDYIPLFFPWYLHYEYRASWIGLPYYNIDPLDSEEKALRGMGVSDDALAWRRWAIKNLCQSNILVFHQEYPSTPEEAFIATGTNVFPISHLRECYQPMEPLVGRLVDDRGPKFIADPTGPLKVYRPPSSDKEWGHYVIGADPTHTTRGDYACAQVFNRRTLEQVAVYRLKIDAANFARPLDLLDQYYNDALLVPEIEGPGYGTVAVLLDNQYPNLWESKVADKTPGKHSDHWGWRTTARSKDLAVGRGIELVVNHEVLLHDRQTFSEMKEYVTLENGGYGNADGTPNDDTVMALCIGLTAQMMEPPLVPYGSGGAVQEPPWESWGQMESGME